MLQDFSLPRPAPFDALKWRCIGPSRGGRVVAVAGDPKDRMTFYFGACAGGIWKTIDGGQYWRNVSDGFLNSAAVGAITVARSDSNIIYAGMGETTIRLDVSYGDGVYKSKDAGRTWKHIGLTDSKHIGRICVHPTNPDIAYAAVLGDIFGPSGERGVYRTRDGGETWDQILERNRDTGAIDLSMDPTNPLILFASLWETRRSPWTISSGGEGSGLFRSFDGGDNWEEISRAPGLPTAEESELLGKIGVSICPVRPGRVWALIEAQNDRTGLYRSENFGASWTLVSSNRDLMHRPWYYTHVFADPCDADTVYVTNLGMWKSTDGGVSFSEINTPHGDNHDLWIDPNDPTRMIEGNDGGACVSFNGGLTWSSIYNQLTAQFYRICVDDEYPYRVYGTQQDNTSIGVPSAAVWGAITLGDCIYPGTGESGFIAVDPRDVNIVYCGAVGSSPGGAGALQRYDHRTKSIQLINVWPEESTGIAPKDLRYRFAWTFPIVFCPHDPGTIYAGGNKVFRTRDEGMSWEEISPDLSRNDSSLQDHSGGPITRESAGAEVHATCACVTPSPHRKGEIWASTDDGLVHVTRDDGETWTDVTPGGIPSQAYVACVEISALDADTVYVCATRYKMSSYVPLVYRSRDSGQNWETLNYQLPDGEITRVVRADPVTPGLLFVGTETGIFMSLDDGENWERMKGGFPVVPVYDLKIKGSDLIAGTHGRSFWVLDDISPLRALADAKREARLFDPRPAIRTRPHFGAMGSVKGPISFGIVFGIGGGIATVENPDGTKKREHLDVGENPPNGALINYWLEDRDGQTVSISILGHDGAEIASFGPDDKISTRPTTHPGLNRFVWDLRMKGPEKLDSSLVVRKNKPLHSESDGQPGPVVLPGRYEVVVATGDETFKSWLTVEKDPRLASADGMAAQFPLLKELHDCLGRLNSAVNRIRRLRRQLDAFAARADSDLADKAKAIGESLATIEGALVDVHRQSPRDVLRNPAGLNDTLIDLINTVSMSDKAPTRQAAEVSRLIMARVEEQLAALATIVTGDIEELNSAALLVPHVAA